MKKLIMIALVISGMNCNAMLAPTKRLAACVAAVIAAKEGTRKYTKTLVAPQVKLDKSRPQISKKN